MTKDNKKTRFGANLTSLLRITGISQAELARNIGRSYQVVSLYCTGNNLPDCYQAAEIAHFLGVTTDQLLFGLSFSFDRKRPFISDEQVTKLTQRVGELRTEIREIEEIIEMLKEVSV